MNSIYVNENMHGYGSRVNQNEREQYLDDFFNDDNTLEEELDPYEFSVEAEAANEDIWDVLDIDESEWDSASEGGFLIF